MTLIAVRPLARADIPTIARWIAAIPLWQRYGLTTERAQTQLENGLRRGDTLLVADTGSAAAQGLAWSLPQGAFGRSAYLRLLGVSPDCVGRGIGAALLAQTEAIAAETSGALFLLVSDFNAGAQRFYARQGYRQIGAIPGYVLPDVTELLFWKRF